MIKEAKILRISDHGEATHGVFLADGRPELVTLERPWLNNARNISCIPDGAYRCVKTTNRHLGAGTIIPVTFEIVGVPDRSGILFHAGNIVSQSEGCVMFGLQWDSEDSPFTILGSAAAMRRFNHLTKDNKEFPLTIETIR
jgi:hypothetical protein